MAQAAMASSSASPLPGGSAGGSGRSTPFPPSAAWAEAGAQRAQTIEAVRQVLLEEVDSKVGERIEELMQRGQQMLLQAHKNQQDNTDRLSAEITRCLERQMVLEEENAHFKQVIFQLGERLMRLAPLLVAGGDGAGIVSSTEAPSTPDHGSPLRECGGTSCSPLRSSGVFTSGEQEPLPFPFPNQATVPSLAATLQSSVPSGAAAVLQLGPPPGMPVALSLASTLPVPEYTFSFTIRKADETDLGLNVSHSRSGDGAPAKVLLVEGIRVGGAVDAWNRQCLGGAHRDKVVMVGDKIICVNGVDYDPDKMLQECKEKQLLRLTVYRGDGPLPELPSLQAAPPKPTSMRVDAPSFVPVGVITAAARTASDAEVVSALSSGSRCS